LVSWQSYGNDGNDYDIRAQRYGADGLPKGGEILVNTTQASWQYQVASATLLDGTGNLVLVWSSYNQDGNDYGIYAQRFTANGVSLGSEFRVNTYTTSAQITPAVPALVGGGFVVTWASYSQDATYGYGIYAQRYDGSGVAQGAEIRVNTYASDPQLAPQVDALTDRRFVVTWQSYSQDGSVYGVYSQRFDADGDAVLVQIDGTVGNDTI